MRKYKPIDKLLVFDGDIIKYKDSRYIVGSGFISCIRFLRVKRINNNLTAVCVKSDGKKQFVNMVDDRVLCGYTTI